MNRHRSNWSAMGCGYSTSNAMKVKSVEECKEHIKEIVNFANFEDSFGNIINALKELRNEQQENN